MKLLRHPSLRALLFLWAAWFLILYGFQALVTRRLDLKRPDYAVSWTAGETGPRSQKNKPYLLDPFMNRQVSWDSEYYVSIALAGYDDPQGRRLPDSAPVPIPLNYAFFPLYPYLMRAVAVPLGLLALTPIARVTLAGLIVSLLGALGAMVALWDLTRDELGDDGGLRTAFYLLIFPTGFFLAQVYTEGLFAGLAFGALALARRRQWMWAVLLAVLATAARAFGAALALPLLVAWLREVDWKRPLRDQLRWPLLAQGLLALAPLAAFAAWRFSTLGQNWKLVQLFFFRRGLLSWGDSVWNWRSAWEYAAGSHPAQIYYALEVFVLALALAAGLALLRRYPAEALFSVAVVVLSALSGVAQSQARYALVAPATYILLSRLGRWPAFDRAWSMLSLLLMGLAAMLFSFDMWVG
jgi:hypothetical protein